jgi:dephospho-CoA kinase
MHKTPATAHTKADARQPLVIGIAGGIGSGKSTVARAFADLGCVVSDSDAQARAALDRPDIQAQLVSWWGDQIVGSDGSVDRQVVGAIVFGDPAQRSRLEGLIHPLVRRSRSELIEQAVASGAPAVIVDAPLLFEVGLDKECDAVVFVDVDRETRVARVRARNGWDEAELDRRENAQLALDEKRRRSDYSVSNMGDRTGLSRGVAEILGHLLRPMSFPIDHTSSDEG